MAKLKLTPWMPPEVTPVRPGVYQVQFPPLHETDDAPAGYSRWTGEHWTGLFTSKSLAWSSKVAGIQAKAWRGLASPDGK